MNEQHCIKQNDGVPMPEIEYTKGPARNGWDGQMWSMKLGSGNDKVTIAIFYHEGLLRRFLQDSWGVGGFGEPIPVSDIKETI